jgi:hypothetical protein
MTRAEAALATRKAHNQAQREALTQKRRELEAQARTLERKARDRRRYETGRTVEDSGLFAARPEELHQAIAQLAKLWSDPLAWTMFICGDLVADWMGPAGTVHVLQLHRGHDAPVET